MTYIKLEDQLYPKRCCLCKQIFTKDHERHRRHSKLHTDCVRKVEMKRGMAKDMYLYERKEYIRYSKWLEKRYDDLDDESESEEEEEEEEEKPIPIKEKKSVKEIKIEFD